MTAACAGLNSRPPLAARFQSARVVCRRARARVGSLWVRFARWAVLSPVVWLLVAANLGSAGPGYLFWYGGALARAPWYLWLFVPDSPLSVTMMGLVLVALHFGKRWDFWGLLASGACLKYGLWTVFVWFTNYLSGGEYHFTAVLMSATHFGMVIEGLIVAVFLRFRFFWVALASVFFVANDLVDYVVGHHPRVPNPVDLTSITWFGVATTIVLVLAWAALAVLRRSRPERVLDLAYRERA